MPPDSCAAEVCGGGEQTVRRPSDGRSTAVAHFSFAQNGRQHWCKRVSGYAYTDGLLPKNERHTYHADYKYDTIDCDDYFPVWKYCLNAVINERVAIEKRLKTLYFLVID